MQLVRFLVLLSFFVVLVLYSGGCNRIKDVHYSDPPVIVRSADEQHIAWVRQSGKQRSLFASDSEAVKVAVYADGIRVGNEYDMISTLVMSPDGTRVAYPAYSGGTWKMVLDGQETGSDWNEIHPGCVVFSPDGSRIAYSALKDERWHVVIDDETVSGDGHDFVRSFVFSPDGKSHAYIADRGNSRLVARDGNVEGPYEMAGNLVFSPDGKRLAYSVTNDEKMFMVVDGISCDVFDSVEDPVFSNDGQSIAYSARNDDTAFVVRDRKRTGNVYPMTIAIEPLVFGPADSRLAFVANNGRGSIVVIDGIEGPEYMDILPDSILLNPDGTGHTYIATNGWGWFVVQNGMEGPGWDSIVTGKKSYSTNGKDHVYTGLSGSTWHIIINGLLADKPEFDEISYRGGPSFSFDDRYIWFIARKGAKWHLVINGHAGPAYDRIYFPVDGKEGMEYLAERDDGTLLVRCVQSYPQDAQVKSASVREDIVSRLPQFVLTEEECVECKIQRQNLYIDENLN